MPESPESSSPNEETPEPEPIKSLGYSVSGIKFWVMNICTFGVYSIYWAYKNFMLLEIAKPKRPRIFAFIHAFFLSISLYRLIGLVQNKAEKAGVPVKLPRVLLAILYFAGRVFDIVFLRTSEFGWLDVAKVCFDTFLLYQINSKILKINRELNPSSTPERKFGKKEIFFCILGILCYAIIFLGGLIPEQKSYQYVRWIFVEPGINEQQINKIDKLDRISTFWQKFKDSESSMRIAQNGEDARAKAKLWMETALPDVDPNIDWDLRVDPENKNINILALTSRVQFGNRPMVEDMISRAPKLDGWKFTSTRPKAPLYLHNILLSNRGINLPNDFVIECSQTKDHLIKVVFKEVYLDEPNSTKSRETALELIDLLIGQDNEEQWIGSLSTEKTDQALPKDKGSEKFISDFTRLKEQLLKERFEKPVSQMNEEERQNAYDVLSDSFSSFPFDSRRFSKFNEKFCYLTVKKKNTFKTPESIQKVISELDQALRAQNCGCTLGGSFDQEDCFYFDLSITDIPKAAQVLKDFSHKNGYGKDAWLEFYDDIWISEWIGMELESPIPEMRSPDRLPK